MNATGVPGRSHPSALSAWLPEDDWSVLAGSVVEIHEAGRVIDRGRVEATTADGGILWLAFDGAASRRLWENVSGRYVRIVAPF
ncbi:hypothetical protein [Pseudarthrobacter scleromae]|uniref:hypothetical protein n=1 Tax=Pseudarthrobacter scleromae TaxID=158897 RepID=UPI003D02A4F2